MVIAFLITVAVPAADEVFSELEIKGLYHAQYSSDYIIFENMDEIEKQLRQTDFMQEALKMTDVVPIFTGKARLGVDSILLEITVEFPNFAGKKGFSIILEWNFEIKIDVQTNLSLVSQIFDFSLNLSVESSVAIKFKYSVEFKDSIPSRDAIAFKEKMASQKENKKTSFKLFKINVPIIPAISLTFEDSIELSFELSAELEIKIYKKDIYTIGVQTTKDGSESYYNETTKQGWSAEITGTVTLKVGHGVEMGISLLLFIQLTAKCEVGVYARLTGFAKFDSFRAPSQGSNDKEADWDYFAGGALYFEVGIYVNFGINIKINCYFFKLKIGILFVDVEIPLFSVGYTEYLDLDLGYQGNCAVLDPGKDILDLKPVKIKKVDMFTGETTITEIPTFLLKLIFDITTTENVSMTEDGYKLSNNSDDDSVFFVFYRLKMVQLYFNFSDINAGDKRRGIVHLELSSLDTKAFVDIIKTPVALTGIELNIMAKTNDVEYSTIHSDFNSDDLTYRPRGAKDGIIDFQIGRLVQVSPIFTPSNATFKTLDYEIVKGSDMIFGDLKIYEINNITYAEFRIKEDVNIIGREIQIKARANGYRGEYSSSNIESSPHDKIIASSIPPRDYEFLPRVIDTFIKQTTVLPGDIIHIGVNNSSVLPVNTTRINEEIFITEGPAEMIVSSVIDSTIQIKEDAKAGDVIGVGCRINGLYKEYYFNIPLIKVNSLTISTSSLLVTPGESRQIDALIESSLDKPVSNPNITFILSKGANISSLSNLSDPNKVILSFSDSSKPGQTSEVFAIVDGLVSNILVFDVIQVNPESLIISTTNSLLVRPGDVISFSNHINPINSTSKNIKFFFVEGDEYGYIDENNGSLTINLNVRGGETIVIGASIESIQSNQITLEVKRMPVRYIDFPEYITEGFGENSEIVLNAFTNSDAFNRNIIYSIITDEQGICQINDNILSVGEPSSDRYYIYIRATSEDDPSIWLQKDFLIFKKISSISVSDHFSFINMNEDSSGDIRVYNSIGDIVSNDLIQFSLKKENGSKYENARVIDGKLVIDSVVPFSPEYLRFVLKATFLEQTVQIDVKIEKNPDEIRLSLKDGANNLNSIRVRPTDNIEFVVSSDDYYGWDEFNGFDDLDIIVTGKADYYIYGDGEMLEQGYRNYTIIVNLWPNCSYSELVTVKAKATLSNYFYYSNEFKIYADYYINEVSFIDIPSVAYLNDEIELKAFSSPLNSGLTPRFSFPDYYADSPSYYDFATLEGNVLRINNDSSAIGKTITVYVEMLGFSSRTAKCEIKIGRKIDSLQIFSSNESKNIKYFEEENYYMIYPDGKFVIGKNIVGGQNNQDVQYLLDPVGQKYFNFDGYTITRNNVLKDDSLLATLIAFQDGIISNTITFAIPYFINNITDWYNINKNVNENYVLAKELDFNGVDYTPIKDFYGFIDGNNYYIREPQFDVYGSYYVGLFINNYGYLCNITVVGALFKTQWPLLNSTIYLGLIASVNYGTIYHSYAIEDGEHIGNIQISNIIMGGISAVNYGIIESSVNTLTIYSSGLASGIVGINKSSGIVSNCTNYRGITLRDYNPELGVIGIIGINEDGGSYNSCVNNGYFRLINGTYLES